MTTRHQGRSRWSVAGALAALAALAGCTTPGAASPIDLPKDRGTGAVTVEARVVDAAASDRLTVSYRLHNGSSDSVWVVDRTSPPVLPDATGGGVAIALAFLPVPNDRTYAQPPSEPVVAIAPNADREGTLTIPRPFTPFDEVEGGNTLTLPKDPASVRVCVGAVPHASVPAEQAPASSASGKLRLNRSTGVPRQELSCSDALPLR